MSATSFAANLSGWVLAGWGRQVRAVRAIDPGMNSLTALVDLGEETFVAKWVTDAPALELGSTIAHRLAQTGLATGEPLLTSQGQVSFPTPLGSLALLRFVPGGPLTGSDAAEQIMIATMLAQVHAAEVSTRSAPFMPEVLDLVHDVEPWVRPAVAAVFSEQALLPPLTWGILHADPAPEAFRLDESTGQLGLIDWTAATWGPVLYDVASAVMYLGGPAHAGTFWTVYCEHSPAPVEELTRHIDAFHRFRGAVQAAYFSARVANSDLTGIAGQQENWKGLRDGQHLLLRHGVLLDQS